MVYLSSFIEDGIVLQKKKCDVNKKTVFLIGDSICVGYREYVKELLADRANVIYPEENCRNSQYIITSLFSWSGICDAKKVDVVQFNCGHWDAAHFNGDEQPLTDEKNYGRNIEMIIRLLRKLYPNAKICFATTTPTNPNGAFGRNPRFTKDIIRYNKAASEACEKNFVVTDDLFSVAEGFDSKMYIDYCHFTKEGFELLAKKVASFIKPMLID